MVERSMEPVAWRISHGCLERVAHRKAPEMYGYHNYGHCVGFWSNRLVWCETESGEEEHLRVVVGNFTTTANAIG
jgi:hypothetical protein